MPVKQPQETAELKPLDPAFEEIRRLKAEQEKKAINDLKAAHEFLASSDALKALTYPDLFPEDLEKVYEKRKLIEDTLRHGPNGYALKVACHTLESRNTFLEESYPGFRKFFYGEEKSQKLLTDIGKARRVVNKEARKHSPQPRPTPVRSAGLFATMRNNISSLIRSTKTLPSDGTTAPLVVKK